MKCTFLLGVFGILLLSLSTASYAVYDSNTMGRITAVVTYVGSDDILFAVDPMPAGPCSTYFVVSGSTSTSSRQQVLSRLLTAYSSQESVVVGYDGTTCYGPYFSAHRVG